MARDRNALIIRQTIEDEYAMYHGDSCQALKGLPDASVGLSVFSPPFAELYSYSDNLEDLGNSDDYNQFFEHFDFIISQLLRVTKPGRHVVIHCIDIPAMKQRDGYIGLKDFPGDIIRAFQKHGFIYHSRHVIWKDPLVEATRTKALGLAHKQIVKDASMCRAGLPDYLIAMRAPGDCHEPVTHPDGFTRYVGNQDPGGVGVKRSHFIWRAYASPVWMDVRQTRTLNVRQARDDRDEKHICPLQLDTIERCIVLWSNAGDVVLSPFAGIGSEGYVALQLNRRFVGIELKDSYYDVAVKNLERAMDDRKAEQGSLL
jgi:DNA modification methylase